MESITDKSRESKTRVFADGVGEPMSAVIADGRPEGRREAADSRLETKHSKVRWRLIPCKCRSRACSRCGVSAGIQTRVILHGKRQQFPKPVLLTLTVDRDKFEGPGAAYDHVRTGKYVARLMGAMGIKRWVCVLQFQEKSGDGWPHWHVLLDASCFPRGWFDYKRLWHLWNKLWGLGGLDVSKGERQASRDVGHAINYITRYLVRSPSRGIPRWFLERSGCRMVASSRAVGALTAGRASDETDLKSREERGESGRLVERLAECRCQCRLVCERVSSTTGEIRQRHVARLKVRAEDLRRSVQGGFRGIGVSVPDGWTSEGVGVNRSGKVRSTWSTPYRASVKALCDAIDGEGYQAALASEIEDRREWFLSRWDDKSEVMDSRAMSWLYGDVMWNGVQITRQLLWPAAGSSPTERPDCPARGCIVPRGDRSSGSDASCPFPSSKRECDRGGKGLDALDATEGLPVWRGPGGGRASEKKTECGVDGGCV